MAKASHDSETTAHGRQAITACAFIHQQFNGVEKLFWPKRAGTKKFLPGVCEFPGGHIDFGEDITKGLVREIKEEFGMTISVGDPFASFTYLNEVKGLHSIEVVFFAKFVDPVENIKLNDDDHSMFVWMSEGELQNQTIVCRPDGEDPEVANIHKGFALLRGDSLNFG